jgi:hypothetical protein
MPTESGTVLSGSAIVFGLNYRQQPIVNIPPDAIKTRVRLRAGRPGRAFVRFPDRVEEWVLGFDDNTLNGKWVLKFKQGVNL